jgi:hypothetical protein
LINNIFDMVEQSFESVKYQFSDMKELLLMDIDDMNNFLRIYYYNKIDINYTLLEFEVRLRALRDKINETS